MKIKEKTIIILIILLTFSISCKKKEDKYNEIHINENIVESNNHIIDNTLDQINAMTLKEKLGQLIIVGFEGEDVNEETQDYIENLKVGGFILFSRNIKDANQTLNLLNNLKKTNSNNNIPLFLSIDEEGGKVSRLSDVFLEIPDAMTIGDENNLELSYELGEVFGKRLKSLGLNMNFAPVLDINSNPENPVIGRRAFGTTPELVSRNAIEVVKGMRNANVIPTGKHFPGHGDTSIDSHVKLPRVDKTLEELKNFEIIPFEESIKENIEMIMVAHILYTKVDNIYPATMSKKIIQELLREELAYEGVIVSDDMTMAALVENYSLEDGVVSFIEAGGDITLVCHGRKNPKLAIEKLEEAVNSGKITEKAIDEKVYRILKLKEKYKLKDKLINNIDLKEINKNTKEFINKIER